MDKPIRNDRCDRFSIFVLFCCLPREVIVLSFLFVYIILLYNIYLEYDISSDTVAIQ